MCSIKVSELGTFYAEDFLHHNSLKKLFHIRNIEKKGMEKEHGLSSFPNSLYHILPQVLSMYRNNPFSI